jgi:hypothetical protein
MRRGATQATASCKQQSSSAAASALAADIGHERSRRGGLLMRGQGRERDSTRQWARPRGNEARRAAKPGLRPLSGTRFGPNSSVASIWQRSRLRPARGRSCWSGLMSSDSEPDAGCRPRQMRDGECACALPRIEIFERRHRRLGGHGKAARLRALADQPSSTRVPELRFGRGNACGRRRHAS